MPAGGALTRRQAEDTLDELLVAERHNLGQRGHEHGAATFADVAAAYLHHLEHVKGREQSTLRDYRGAINKHLNPRWGQRPVTSITSDDVEQLRDDLLGTHLSSRTVMRQLILSNAIFKFAMRRHGVIRNPASAELVDRPSVNYSGEFRVLTVEQLQMLVEHAENEQDAALYLAAAMTGLRQGELRALRWMDIDFAGDRIHVRRSATVGSGARIKTPKSGRVRSVPMAPQVAEALVELWQREHFTDEQDLVFPNVVGEVENDTLMRRRYFRALERAGVPAVRFHDLRHMFGSMAVKVFAISDVQAMLGHAHISTTMRYLHHRPGKDDAARLTKAFAPDTVESLFGDDDE